MSEERLELARKAASLYHEGKTFSQIGAILGVHGAVIKYWLVKTGVKLRQRQFKTEAAQRRAARLLAREQRRSEQIEQFLSKMARRHIPTKDGDGWHVWTPERQFRDPNR